ncbi:hypothetical protein ED28_07895 [[Pantoea] beijingensis]|uniref:OmpR/PhoB-type domain-containing protein n=1 Tax=[Pantoea] beijingensis TaxID=1324864 RepID=A0A443IDZ1_9GAMM|nr:MULTISPECIES: hypothetical protein [Erwiniaceae]RWR02293.1 hypothetical protein ED28_07895 [[Pantoea] beijingensis]
MELNIYGYCINDNLEFRLSPALLVNVLNGNSIRLRKTMARLLCFLLENHEATIISDTAIMTEVFECHGLRCSRQRLWKAMNTLQLTLHKCGLSTNLLSRVDKCGFAFNEKNIKTLFFYSA